MVHDLTANRDFQNNRTRLFPFSIPKNGGNGITSPYEEVVLTGTIFDRDDKRYILDYESDTKNMCDCCGAPIRIRPCDFAEIKTLCPECEKWLEETQSSKAVRYAKPWDMRDFEIEKPIENVLLWD